MTELKLKALELAGQHEAPSTAPEKVIARAHTYHDFLTVAGTAAPAKPAAAAPAANKTGAGATSAPPPGQQKPAASKPAAPAAGAKPAAGKPAAGGKSAAKPGTATNAKPPAADSKAPDGTATFEDMTKALQTVLTKGVNPKAPKEAQLAAREQGKTDAYKILKEVGQASSAKDVKPALYDAVVAACAAFVAAPAPAPAPSAGAADTDDFGAPVDSDVDSDPPEQVSGGGSAEGEDL